MTEAVFEEPFNHLENASYGLRNSVMTHSTAVMKRCIRLLSGAEVRATDTCCGFAIIAGMKRIYTCDRPTILRPWMAAGSIKSTCVAAQRLNVWTARRTKHLLTGRARLCCLIKIHEREGQLLFFAHKNQKIPLFVDPTIKTHQYKIELI